jgi:hypothetical protein
MLAMCSEFQPEGQLEVLDVGRWQQTRRRRCARRRTDRRSPDAATDVDPEVIRRVVADDLIDRYPSVIHAELAQNALHAYGVDVVILHGTVDERHDVFVDRTIDLMVRPEDVERALEILGPEEQFSD